VIADTGGDTTKTTVSVIFNDGKKIPVTKIRRRSPSASPPPSMWFETPPSLADRHCGHRRLAVRITLRDSSFETAGLQRN
jgi:hypothetical protein